ncbi:hypothetical protein [Bifidobacterium simiarum]|uniref:hypothetical protein n=1 Tax=Bifidobacterium simiarum TaxID=2045441 RepID=UPI0010544CAF|nr:hypothetical protein [Bifidobacterium simiarum]
MTTLARSLWQGTTKEAFRHSATTSIFLIKRNRCNSNVFDWHGMFFADKIRFHAKSDGTESQYRKINRSMPHNHGAERLIPPISHFHDKPTVTERHYEDHERSVPRQPRHGHGGDI